MIPEAQIHRLLDDVEVVDLAPAIEPDAPVVALAHGAGGGVLANFEVVARASGGRHRLIGPNYPGVGATPLAEEPLSLETLADQVVAAGLAAGATRFPVVGLSLGAAVAVTAAVRHPDHVSALVLTVGLSHPDAQSLALVGAWRALTAAGDLDGLARLLLLTSLAPDDLAAIGPEGYESSWRQVREGYPPGGDDHVELVGRVDVRPLLDRVDVPTLVVVGGQDRIVLPESAREFADISGAQLIEYPSAGHIFVPPTDQQWARDVLGFLDRVDQAAVVASPA